MLGRVHGHEPRAAEPPRELARRARDQPVVGVHEVEGERVAERGARRAHVVVHGVDPPHERVEVVLGELRLAHAVHGHAVAVLDRRQAPAAAREHVHLDPAAHQPFGELANMARQPALDDRRVLPGQDEDTRGHAGRGPYRAGARLPPPPREPVPRRRGGRAARRAARPPRPARAATRCPDLDAVDGIISFGGAQSVTEIDRYPYLLAEAEFLKRGDGARRARPRRLPRRPAARPRARRQRSPAPQARRGLGRAPPHRRGPADRDAPRPGARPALERGRDRAAARRDRAARARRARLRRVPHRERVGRAVPPRRRRPDARRLVRDYGELARRGRRRSRRRPRGRRPPPPGQAATAQALFGGFAELTRARAARARAPR